MPQDAFANRRDVLEQRVASTPRLLERPIVRGEGAFLWDDRGKRYLDFISGHDGAITGHSHPRVVSAIREQAGRLLHRPPVLAAHPVLERLEAGLGERLPDSLQHLVFAGSGADAVADALQLARWATGRYNVIVLQRAVRGEASSAARVAVQGPTLRRPGQPPVLGLYVAPYAYCYRCPKAEAAPERYGYAHCCGWPLEEVRFLLKSESPPEETAAILVEPVLAQAGYVVPPASFLSGLKEICREHGILLVFDEVHSGFGRSGRFFALEHTGVVPDILVMGHGLASGLSLAGIAVSPALREWLPPYEGVGDPLAWAAAEATIQVLEEERLLQNAAIIGRELLERLKSLQARYPALGEVRGQGLMVGVEFVVPGGRTPDKDRTRDVQRACLEAGLLLSRCGVDGNVLRWAPPLVIGRTELEEALAIFEHSLAGVISS
jgi:4-aminobutyrate aminotransferase